MKVCAKMNWSTAQYDNNKNYNFTLLDALTYKKWPKGGATAIKLISMPCLINDIHVKIEINRFGVTKERIVCRLHTNTVKKYKGVL